VSVQIEPARCTGCSRCLMCCPVDAIRVWAGCCRVLDHCIDCNVCALYCPADAIAPAPPMQARATAATGAG
jgi:Fe-S-cluster-containing hydrogenase component 2